MAKLLNKHVAESNLQPERLVRSQGQVHYNYNVHRVEEDRNGERVTMYRYNVLVFDEKPTDAEVGKVLEKLTLDSKDTVSTADKAQAVLCDETKVPDWSHPETVEMVNGLEKEPVLEK
jgi:hypothetical protein